MRKTIIALYGCADIGKSSTIKEVHRQLLFSHRNAQPVDLIDGNFYYGDILTAIALGGVKIGFESQGDPNGRTVTEDSLRELGGEVSEGRLTGCDIVVCASRTSGQTMDKVRELAAEYDYRIIWLTSMQGPEQDHKVLNKKQAENIVSLIREIIIGQI